MKKIFLFLLLFTFVISSYSQRADLTKENIPYNIKRICINDKINNPDYQKEVLENTKIYSPELYQEMVSYQLQKTNKINYLIGDKKDFFVLNITNSRFESIKATLKAKGKLVNIWVDTTEMTNEHITMTEINAILNDLENSTPLASRNPNKGIVAIDNEYFGNPPNYDGDGMVDFLLCDIKDGFDGSGDYVAGFFYSNDQTTNIGSNRCDLLYIDTYPSIYYNGSRRLSTVLQTTAHEYQHLIHYNYDKSEIYFVNEALSQNAEIICGYDVFNSVKESDFFSNTNISLFDWQGRIADYSRATLWLLYFTEQLGDNLLKKLVQNPLKGLDGINSALSQVSSPLSFQELIANWSVANYYKDKYSNPMFGYDYPVNGRPNAKLYSNPNVFNYTDYVYLYASKYIVFNSQSKNFKFKFTSEKGNIRIKMLAFGPNEKKYNDINLNEETFEYDFMNKYETIVFVITNIGSNPWADFTLNSSGTVVLENDEIAYDNGTPQAIGETGISYLNTTAYPYGGWAVKFTPKNSQNRLKKVKFWVGFDQEFDDGTAPFNAPKRFQVHIWKALNDSTPGEDLITPFIYQSYRSQIADDFIEIDLNAYKDKLSNINGPIFVGFLEDDDYVTAVAINNSSPNENNTVVRGLKYDTLWYSLKRLSILGNSLSGWNAMIRAYFVYYVSTGVEELEETLPNSYNLSQNYPNPFNPSTKVEYNIPVHSFVNITIYDILGRKIKTLVNEFQNAGRYIVNWDGCDDYGKRVASGIYFCKMNSKNYSSIRKMNLLK
ncbi:MAG TPA: T9SS type A sorting domain-containing protein [Ignavibacteria bacterium]